MVEKIIVSPLEVRGLGDIVSSKQASDFLVYKGMVSSGTDSTLGTVFSESYKAGSSLTLSNVRRISSDASSFTVSATLKDSSSVVISGATVYCDVNGTVSTGTTNSSGVVSWSITTNGSELYHIRVYYLGSSTVGGSFAGTSVAVSGTASELDLQANKPVIQTGEVSNLWATLTDTDGKGVPFASVNFYEEWTPAIRTSASKSVIQTGDSINLSAQLIDATDGSLVRESGHDVTFYQELNTGIIYNDSTEYTSVNTTGDNIVLLPAEFLELPKQFELSFDMKITVGSTSSSDCRFFIGEKSMAVPTNPNRSIFIGKANSTSTRLAYGYRLNNSTDQNSSTVSFTGDYQSCKIVRDNNIFSFYQGDTLLGTKSSLTWFKDYDCYVLGLVAWGTAEVKVKNVKLYVIGDDV